MRLIAVCPVACERCCALELERLGGSGFELGLGSCCFESADPWLVLRYAQTVSHVLLDAGSADPVSLSVEAEDALRGASSFRASALDASASRERELAIGSALFDRFKVKVDLEDPEVEIGIVGDRLGIVLSGFDYSLREYKVYKTPRSLNPCVAASILYGLSVPPATSFCDPLAGDGVLPIEFALMALGVSPRRFQERTLASRFASRFADPRTQPAGSEARILALDENANHLRRAQHNARLAGLASQISFSRYDLEWIDLKLGERSVDRVVLELPYRTARGEDAAYAKALEHVGFAAAHMLSDDGELVVVTNDPLVSFPGFAVRDRLVVPRGELALYAFAMVRA